ncbi:MAG: peptidase S9 [Chitinivibrionales bacterium]|nr:peptidase S9 [Chitinivibrionales bacterium]
MLFSMFNLQRHMQFLQILLLCIVPIETRAQYFGRNKVQYENFDFNVMHADPFSIHYYPEELTAVSDAARMLQRWDKRYATLFDTGLSSGQPIVLYANHADFQQTNVISGRIPQSTGGVTEGLRERVVIPLTGIYAENDHVLGHELVHVYHYALMKSLPRGLQSSRNIPLWFIEGMSEYLSVGSSTPLTAMWMRDALINNDLPTIEKVSRDPSYFPYRYGHAIWAYIGGTWGDTIVPRLYYSSLKSSFRRAVENELGIDVDSLSVLWRKAIKNEFAPDLKGRINPSGYGTPVITGEGGLNLSPSVSPDGKYVVFFSRRNIFTLSLYLANLKTGKIVKQLVRAQTNAHFDALQFTNTSGTWSPDGSKFAFVVFKKGDNSIRVININTLKTEGTYQFDELEAITGIAWSPDGNKLAVTGTDGGIADLFLYNIDADSLTRLTNNRHAELQPSWSPDGSTIAFITDNHPSTSFDSLLFSRPQIALYNLSEQKTTLYGFGPWCKHINPHFSSDGKSIYFVADPDGFSDIFRYSLKEDTYYRITNIATGVSGLTDLSPALSVSGNDDSLVFTVFENREYNLYSLTQERIEEEVIQTDQLHSFIAATTLPPHNPQDPGLIDTYLNKPWFSAIATKSYSVDDYEADLSFLSVGRLSAGAAIDQSGSALGAGAHLLFSDLLSNHLLAVTAQINGSFEDAAGQIVYHNRAQRLNWLAGASHVPYRDVQITSETDTMLIDSQRTSVEEITIAERRTFTEKATAALEFPFNVNRRVEFSTGYTRIWSKIEGTTYFVHNDQIIDSSKETPSAPKPLNLIQSPAALVGDFSIFGFTAPIEGRRYRIEVEPTVGTLNYISLALDYRHYFNWRPLTLAVRALHYGRYLEDGESDRLSPLHIGYGTLVRGYEPWTFDVDDCNDGTGEYGCAELDRLFGSRIAVGNVEVRVPLLGIEGYGLIDFRYLPLDLAAFADAGVAWTSTDYPEPEYKASSKERIPVASAGISTRMNLLGFLVLQLYYAYPFQRTDEQWRFGWLLAPGW